MYTLDALPSHTSHPALFDVFIRETPSNSFLIPTIIRSNENKLTRLTENDRLTLHISKMEEMCHGRRTKSTVR